MSRLVTGVLVVLFGGLSVLLAQEIVSLTTTESNASYRLERLILDPDDPATAGTDEGVIEIRFVGIGQPTNRVTCRYSAGTTPTATTLIVALNKANLSLAYAANATTGSLRQRINHRLLVMGEAAAVCTKNLVGSLSGNPQ